MAPPEVDVATLADDEALVKAVEIRVDPLNHAQASTYDATCGTCVETRERATNTLHALAAALTERTS